VSALDRTHYQLLLELDRLGTISAAATALFVTQSAASQRLREAERRLGFALTKRSGRTVALTPAAQRLVEAARISERTLEAAEADARWLSSSGAPALQVAQDVHDLGWWLAPVLAELDDLPGAAGIELLRAPAGGGLTMVLEGRADAVITPADPAPAQRIHPLFDDELVAVVSVTSHWAERRALTPEDFIDADYVTYSTIPQEGFEHSTFFAPRRVWPKRILRVESISAILDLVAAGPWRSVLPRWTVTPGRGVTAVALDPSPPPITWSLASRNLDGHIELQNTVEHLAGQLPGLFRQAWKN
jgi:LysR family transcriptional regulator for metE and metH